MAHKKETRTVTITLEQTQVDKAKNVPLFHVPVEVEVEDAEGVVYRGVAVFHGDATKAFVTLAVGDSAPAMVRIDPDGNILCTVDFNHGETTLGAVARGGKDVVSRIRAFYELIKIGSPTAMATVHDALLAEPFYGVRVKGIHAKCLCL